MTKPPTRTSTARRWLWLGLSLLMLAAVVVFVWEAEDTANITAVDVPPPEPAVTVLDVAPAEAVAAISAFGELRPRWDADIRAAVSGRITRVHAAALAGERVAADAPLFSIEKTRYGTAVAAAELSVEEAKLALWQAQNGVALARREFERNSDKPPNDLALRIPQLRIAERRLASAEAQLAAARQELADTEVKAPFSGFIVERSASLGQTVSTGEALVRLADDRQYELTVEISSADWDLLARPVAGRRAELFHRDGSPLGEAHIRRGGGFLDQQTRQRRIYLDVVNPGADALAGDFVRVVFTGRVIDNTLTVPESALTRAGYIWSVDPGNLLVRTEPDILFRNGDALIIAAPDDTQQMRVAVTPLTSFLPGQRVLPRTAGE